MPVIAHQEMGGDRMREIHGFLETLSSWLALQDEAHVNELRLCIGVKDEIQQDRLPADTAARSAKLFYLLSQSLAKWERGLELLRSCSKRQNMSATGYEAVWTIHTNSIVFRMEAVYVREACMKIHAKCGHLKKPIDIIRYLEDGIAKAEVKLSNFPELKLSEVDRCSLLLQAVSHQARQYVALYGNAQSWGELTKSLKYFEEQLSSSSRSMDGQDVLCDHCGRKGHKKDKCWAKQRNERGDAKPDKGKGRPKDKKGGKGDHKGEPGTPRGGKPSSAKGDKGGKGGGKDKEGKGKGKDKKKKKKNCTKPGRRARVRDGVFYFRSWSHRDGHEVFSAPSWARRTEPGKA